MATNKQIEIDLLIKTAKSVKSTEAQKAVLLDIYETLKKVEKGSTAFDTLTEAANGLKQSLGGVNATFEEVYGNVQPLTSRLGELEDRMYELALAGQQNTQEFKDLQSEAVKMRKTIIDVDASVDAFAQKGAKIKAFGGIVSGLAGAFGSAQAAVGLLGGNTEGFEKSILKLQQVMMIMQGVQEVTNLLTEKNIILEGIANFNRRLAIKLVGEKVVATAAEAVATGTATVAQRALNMAMSANPIGLIIVAIGTLIGLYSSFGDETEDNEKKTKDYNDELERTKKLKNELRSQSLDLQSVYKQEAIDQLQYQLDNEKNLEKQKALLDQIAQKKKEQVDLDAKADAMQSKFGENVDKVKAIQEKTIQYNNKISKQTSDLSQGVGKNTKKIIDEYIKQIKTTGDYNSAILQVELERETLQSGEINNITTIQGGLSKLLDLYTNKKEAQKKFTEETEINYEDVKLFYKGLANDKKKTDAQAAVDKQKIDRETAAAKKALDDQAEEERKKREEEQKKAEEERRRRQIEELTDEYERRKSASDKIRDIQIENIDDLEQKEIEYQELVYGREKQAIIDRAIQRELKKNEELFTEGKKNKKQFEADRLKITQDGTKYLLDEESKLIIAGEDRLKKSKELIKSKYKNEGEITIAETKKINAELAKLEIERQKAGALSTIKTSVDAGAKEKLKLTQKNLDAILDAARVEEEQYNRLKKKDEELIQKAKERTNVTEELKNEEIAAIEEVAKKREDKYVVDKKRTDDAIDDAKKQNEEAKKNALDDIEAAKKVTEVKKSFKDAEKKASKDLADAELEVLREKYEYEISKAGLTKEQKAKIDAQYALDRKAIETRSAQESIEIENNIVEKKIEKDDKLLDYKKQLAEDILNLERTIQDTIMSFIEQETNERLKQNDLIYQDKISKIDAEEQKYQDFIANRTIAEQTTYDIEQGFADQRKNAERTRQLEEDKIKKKAFEAQKINDATSVAINYGVAIAKAFKDFGWPFGLIPAAFLGVQLGVEEAAILNKKYIPQYAKGGIHFGDGQVTGPGTGTSDDINAKLSNGEVVINAKSSKKFAPILSAINEAGGGKKIPHLASGGIGVSNATVSNMSNENNMSINTNLDLQPLIDAITSQNKEIYVKESTVTNAQNSAEKLKRRTRF